MFYTLAELFEQASASAISIPGQYNLIIGGVVPVVHRSSRMSTLCPHTVSKRADMFLQRAVHWFRSDREMNICGLIDNARATGETYCTEQIGG